MQADPSYSSYTNRHYLLYIIEGGAFIGAVGFINPQTLLPSLILELNGPVWLAAFAPSLMVIGMFSFPMLSYGIIERLNTYKRFTLSFGLFQRLIYLVAALVLLMFPNRPLLAVVVLTATPFLSGAIGGICLTAWQQLFMGAVPANRRASNFAIRFLIGGVMGVVAGKTIELTLARYPGSVGYAYLHLYASFFFLLSFVALLFVKENPNYRSQTPALKTQGSWKAIISLLSRQELRLFWPILFLMHCMFLLTPFYAVDIRERFQEDTSFLGVLAVWQMLGSSMGNLTAGLLGDRIGGRNTFIAGMVFFAMVIIPGAFSTDLLHAKVLYMGFGFFMMISIVGKDTLIMEIAPDQQRALYLSLAAFISMLGMLFSSIASYIIWQSSQRIELLALPTAAIFLINAMLLSIGVTSPEKRKSPLKVIQRGVLRYFR